MQGAAENSKMDRLSRASFSTRRVPRPAIWSLCAIAAMAVVVEISRTALDILVLIVLCTVLIILERTVGDWISEVVGPGLGTAALAICCGGLAWPLFTPGGP